MYAFITPMPLEYDALIENAKVIENKRYGITSVSLAEYEGRRFILAKCGIGKVNAAMATQKVIDLFGKELEGIIVVGVAGSLDKEKAPLFKRKGRRTGHSTRSPIRKASQWRGS